MFTLGGVHISGVFTMRGFTVVCNIDIVSSELNNMINYLSTVTSRSESGAMSLNASRTANTK